MKILDVLSQNLSHGSRTRQPNDVVPYPEDFRGKLSHALELCTACGTCVYTCSPGAIKIDDADENVVHWIYMEDRCTFCGFCVQYCPTHALSFEKEAPAPITERSQHYISHDIVLPACKVCGRPVRVIPELTLKQLYGSPLPEEIVEAQGLCENCRQKLISKRFLKTIVFTGDPHGK
ncbi:formate hydrogenlyase subunit 6/NADH:ubiquinone oxidoreductase 23 kD subunit [Longilinea arvoryzae]|uniref:Formate hydrogenlyase subunit 6/NADH:ubiquinone oxidoreductase 23 kD subunit n=1 Tax=Longilinea arvoryzae TaxID=360412 RepID=A0A0S7BGI6_9CHLR|nr:4Fe-4S dicluster domain-containing protein [Longilinea arvoryzae]GAP13651.1 formate hydrogenlyase subunit 6/NADH:ubiquinone oxidoreductase 23 kD subunit [Longilinea arvoryzae]